MTDELYEDAYEADQPDITVTEDWDAPKVHPGLKRVEIRPQITDAEYKALHGCFLLPEHGPLEAEPNTAYFTRNPETGEEHVKFLLLPDVLRNEYMGALLALENAKWGAGTRGSAGSQPHARKITYGFYPQKPGHVAGNDYHSIRTAPTLEQPNLAWGLKKFVRRMDALVAEYLPLYYEKAFDASFAATQREDVPEDDWTRVDRAKSPLPDGPNPLSVVKGTAGAWGHRYTLWNTVFSTLELNNHILFKAHEDEYNLSGALICIAALGIWVGGRLIFPRYKYGVDLKPFDLLICDNHTELHGNIGPLVGPKKSGRFSVVAFLHTNVVDYANRQGLWREKSDAASTEK